MNLFRRSTPWTLADWAQRHADAPETYRVPTAEVLATVQVGDRVKLVVVPRDGLEERLWVRVTEVGPDELAGNLASDPAELRGLRAGDAVRFERRHVVAVARQDPGATVGK
ncbi:hypothetical protein [uncultured Cellulomonas sp.]|uniref:hypothetical protein n=1 Tax=uncultured Cellulomonas sp. TaxID=189682 RepID=UPI0028E1FAC5|nr:hypothetical protein [uncultured Cellulomonas sp.]